jgi:hypothetical protein
MLEKKKKSDLDTHLPRKRHESTRAEEEKISSSHFFFFSSFSFSFSTRFLSILCDIIRVSVQKLVTFEAGTFSA